MPGSDLFVLELDDLLEGHHQNGTHLLGVDRPAAEIAGILGAADWRLIALQLDDHSTKQSVLAGLSVAGDFPGWVGANWDALLDALRDLSWSPAQGYAILIDNWTAFATASPRDAATLRSVLADAAQWWQEAGTPFHLLLRA